MQPRDLPQSPYKPPSSFRKFGRAARQTEFTAAHGKLCKTGPRSSARPTMPLSLRRATAPVLTRNTTAEFRELVKKSGIFDNGPAQQQLSTQGARTAKKPEIRASLRDLRAPARLFRERTTGAGLGARKWSESSGEPPQPGRSVFVPCVILNAPSVILNEVKDLACSGPRAATMKVLRSPRLPQDDTTDGTKPAQGTGPYFREPRAGPMRVFSLFGCGPAAIGKIQRGRRTSPLGRWPLPGAANRFGQWSTVAAGPALGRFVIIGFRGPRRPPKLPDVRAKLAREEPASALRSTAERRRVAFPKAGECGLAE